MKATPADKIRDAVRRRGIDCLLHFTQAANLGSIVEHGLLSEAMLTERPGIVAYSSGPRLDGRKDIVSVSISAINTTTFQSKGRGSGHGDWLVLLLDPAILWTQECRFCWTNTASNKIKKHTGYLGGPWGFDNMFSDEHRPPRFEGHSYRTETGIPDDRPTCADAEVQVTGAIHADAILGIWAADEELAGLARAQLGRFPEHGMPILVKPFVPFSNGYDTWFVPGEG